MKYFIFGGNGFVGRYLANALLERNEKVVVCDLLLINTIPRCPVIEETTSLA